MATRITVHLVPITHRYDVNPGSSGPIIEYIASLEATAEAMRDEVRELRELVRDVSPGGLSLRYHDGTWTCDMGGVWADGPTARVAMLRCQQIVLHRETCRRLVREGAMPSEEIQDVAGVEIVMQDPQPMVRICGHVVHEGSSGGIAIAYDRYRDQSPLMGRKN